MNFLVVANILTYKRIHLRKLCHVERHEGTFEHRIDRYVLVGLLEEDEDVGIDLVHHIPWTMVGFEHL